MGVNDDQELEALDTLSLTDFHQTDDADADADSSFEDHHPLNPPSDDLFEFFNGGSSGHHSDQHRMSHAEDIIFAGKLIPINDQQQQQPRAQSQTRKQKQTHRRRSESMRELKSTTTNYNPKASRLVRNSYSLDYKKLSSSNSRLFNYEPTTADIHRNSLGNKTSSSRWSDLVFGPVKVPAEMDLRDIRNRQNTSRSLFPDRGGDGFSVGRNNIVNHRKTSWGVLGILSCKSSRSVAVTMP